MKTSTYKYFLLFGFTGFLIACSTKKNNFVNRNWHAVTTEYNVLYNGEIALEAGINDVKATYADDYWDVLPVERMQPTLEEMAPTDKVNPNFERAEGKAAKAIQKHSMNIANSEKNPQMDEAHLLLGKTRYYDNRFIPALEAFNYILYKHPNSDKIYEAKVWREKTNIRLENESIALKNLKLLLKEKLEPQVYADANAIMAQAYINLEAKDSAITVLRNAARTTELNEEKARYNFILGQLFEKTNATDSAYAYYQKVIDMKRKSPRRYVIQAHGRQAAQFDYKTGDTLVFMEKYKELLEDRENRPYLDALNHQVALFYDKQNLDPQAKKYYNKSLRSKSADRYLMASNHRNLAEINFENAKYPVAGMYYDSTMTYLNARSREFKSIKKKRDNLNDVIKYETIAQNNDSILHIVALSQKDRITFFEDYIVKLIDQEQREKARMEAAAKRAASMPMGNPDAMAGGDLNGSFGPKSSTQPATALSKNSISKETAVARVPVNGGSGASGGVSQALGGNSKFYFYTPSTVSFGKLEFQKKWGKRALTENWRWADDQKRQNSPGIDAVAGNDSLAIAEKDKPLDPKYTTEFYLKQLPTSQKILDSLATERNFAYYQLGTIYKEKFKEYQRAADKLEKLLVNNPEERLVLPAKYNLFKIYEIIDPAKAATYKQQILTGYPDSRYAEIIRNPLSETLNNGSPGAVYGALYKKYEKGDAREVLAESEALIETYTGEDIVSKFEMLKATSIARVRGLEEYKKALNFVSLNYPNSDEGKQAEAILSKDIPMLEKMAFGSPAGTYKIIFKFDSATDPRIKPLTEKLQKFIKEGLNNTITLSNDIYTMNENFVVIHGFHNKLAAQDAVSVLKDYKAYKISETPIIISSEDYKVVQVKKNLTEYVAVK